GLEEGGRMASVVIVDDDADITAVVQEVLELEGYEVHAANDGSAGLRLVRERLPDVVISDVEMPQLDGPGMADRMLIEDCGMEEIPVVLVSGAPDLMGIARRVGTPYVIAKPCTPRRLLAEVERALREQTPPRPSGWVGARPVDGPRGS